MMFANDLILRSVMLILLCGAVTTVVADDEAAPIKVTLHPAREARPALRYQLLPKYLDRISGNAAVHYGKVTAGCMPFFTDQEQLDKIEHLREAPLEELRDGDVQLKIGLSEYFLKQAARCKYCDWQLPIGEEPFFSIALPDAQESRQFARILAARARIQIARGQFEEAVETLQNGYALGQHLAAGETLIHGLIGIAVSGIMSDHVLELVQQPEAPNLYWALTLLPRPLIDMRAGIEAEMHSVALSFRSVRELESKMRSPDEWRVALQQLWEELIQLNSQSDLLARPEVLTALSIRGYSMAKSSLIEWGFDAEEVEAMPVSQVILIYVVRQYERLRDDTYKWFYVPYRQSIDGLNASVDELREASRSGREIIPLANMLLPAMQSCRRAIVRMDRQIAVLRVLEALRMYAAENDGKLPSNLSEITAVEVPLDPVTEKPFQYSLDGNVARLQGPPLPGRALSYEISIAP